MFVLPELPYAANSLEPVISARTLGFHHGKHHKTYVETLNTLLAEADDRLSSLEEVIRETADDPDRRKLFNNAAQSWNHAFFWDAMTPAFKPPSGDLAKAIHTAFGDLTALRTAFVEEGVGHFASGWVWLVAEGETFEGDLHARRRRHRAARRRNAAAGLRPVGARLLSGPPE